MRLLFIEGGQKMGKLGTNCVSRHLHRVVRSDFSVGGYGLGGEVKLRLLQRENRGYEEEARLKINDEALPLFAVKRVLEKAGMSKN